MRQPQSKKEIGIMSAEWERFKVGVPSKKRNSFNRDCKPLEVVNHVAHIQDAIRILEDGFIRSSLIWDKSRLSNTRTCVSWVSPNDWTNGSIYGNVAFKFDWEALKQGRKLYWVEAVEDYTPQAYRFLISSKNLSKLTLVKPYNEISDEGPIRLFNNKSWYWNGKFTAELMIDENLCLKQCRQIEFISHHEDICTKQGRECSDRVCFYDKAGSIMMAAILGRRLMSARELMLKDGKITDYVRRATNTLIKEIRDQVQDNSSDAPEENEALLRASLLAFGYRDNNLFKQLVKVIGDKSAIQDAMIRIMADYFDVENHEMRNQLRLGNDLSDTDLDDSL